MLEYQCGRHFPKAVTHDCSACMVDRLSLNFLQIQTCSTVGPDLRKWARFWENLRLGRDDKARFISRKPPGHNEVLGDANLKLRSSPQHKASPGEEKTKSVQEEHEVASHTSVSSDTGFEKTKSAESSLNPGP